MEKTNVFAPMQARTPSNFLAKIFFRPPIYI